MDSNHQSDLRSMSAIGTKRTSLVALHMSAFGAKAGIEFALRNVCLSPEAHIGRT